MRTIGSDIGGVGKVVSATRAIHQGSVMVNDWTDGVSAVMNDAENDGFSGVVRVELAGEVLHESAHGFADRAHGIANQTDTRLAAASGLKPCMAIVVMRLVEGGALSLDTRVRDVLGEALPLVDPSVDVRQLLTHRSGIADYCSEPDDPEAIHGTKVPQCWFDTPESVVRLLADMPIQAAPGAEFRYNNAGYVLLARIAEQLTGLTLYDLLDRYVFEPAGMHRSSVLCTDELPGDAAIGYLQRSGLRTNVHHVPRRGLGDGGLYTTADDISRLWRALRSGTLLRPATFGEMTTPHGYTHGGTPYGMGFWLSPYNDSIELEGYDSGISFRSVHQPSRDVTWTVLSNWTDGAWSVTDQLAQLLGTDRAD